MEKIYLRINNLYNDLYNVFKTNRMTYKYELCSIFIPKELIQIPSVQFMDYSNYQFSGVF